MIDVRLLLIDPLLSGRRSIATQYHPHRCAERPTGVAVWSQRAPTPTEVPTCCVGAAGWRQHGLSRFGTGHFVRLVLPMVSPVVNWRHLLDLPNTDTLQFHWRISCLCWSSLNCVYLSEPLETKNFTDQLYKKMSTHVNLNVTCERERK